MATRAAAKRGCARGWTGTAPAPARAQPPARRRRAAPPDSRAHTGPAGRGPPAPPAAPRRARASRANISAGNAVQRARSCLRGNSRPSSGGQVVRRRGARAGCGGTGDRRSRSQARDRWAGRSRRTGAPRRSRASSAASCAQTMAAARPGARAADQRLQPATGAAGRGRSDGSARAIGPSGRQGHAPVGFQRPAPQRDQRVDAGALVGGVASPCSTDGQLAHPAMAALVLGERGRRCFGNRTGVARGERYFNKPGAREAANA